MLQTLAPDFKRDGTEVLTESSGSLTSATSSLAESGYALTWAAPNLLQSVLVIFSKGETENVRSRLAVEFFASPDGLKGSHLSYRGRREEAGDSRLAHRSVNKRVTRRAT